jgi:Na+-driven multidrug efflux pump
VTRGYAAPASVQRALASIPAALKSDLFRSLWRVSLPLVFLSATETVDNLINIAFMARLGTTELAAIGMADSVLGIFCVAPLALVDGVQIVTAQSVGARRSPAVATAFNQGLVVIVLVSLLMTLCLKLASPVFASAIVGSAEVGKLLDSFLQLAAYGIAFTGATFAYGALLVSLGRTWVLVPATIIFVVVDLCVNYLLVFGKLGLPQLGIRGLAVGFLVAGLCVFLFLTAYLWLRVRSSEYPLFRFRGFEKRAVTTLSRLSAPLSLESFLETIRWLLFFLILERAGVAALAVGSIVYACYVVLWIPTEGFADTTCSMAGRMVGRKRGGEIGRLLRYATSGSLLATVPFLALALIAPQVIVGIFSPEAGVLADSSAAVRMAALGMLVTVPGAICASALAGTGDTPAVFVVELILTCTMLVLTYLAAIVLQLPVAWVWLALPLAWLVALAVAHNRLRSGTWTRVTV